MHLDGRITEILIRRFTAMGIPILTVHDSYLVPWRHADLLEAEMQSAYREVMGMGPVEVKRTWGHGVPEAAFQLAA